MSTDGNTAMPLPDSSSSPPAESDIAQHVTDTANSNSWASKVGRAEADFGAAAQQDGDEDMVVTTELVFSGNDAKQDEGQEQGGNANATATADADAVTVAADGDGEEVVAAEFDDCLVGKTLVIRGRPATIVKRDYPLVYWTFDDDADVPPMEKHRSYLSAQDIFQVQRKNKATEAEISAACEEETGAGGDSDFDY